MKVKHEVKRKIRYHVTLTADEMHAVRSALLSVTFRKAENGGDGYSGFYHSYSTRAEAGRLESELFQAETAGVEEMGK